MDETILASAGAYNGRDDFIREALADRIAEERMRPRGGPAPVLLLPSTRNALRVDESARLDTVGVQKPRFPVGLVPTLPATPSVETLYGLHNRDYPTLWGAHSLIEIVAERGAPIPWDAFLDAALPSAWRIGAELARLDFERSDGELKAAVGFPLRPEKRQSSEARFVEHMLGSPYRPDGPGGPLFALQLVGGRNDASSKTWLVAPTAKATDLLRALTDVGFGARPPHSEEAWRLFRGHIMSSLIEDYETWMRVLSALRDEPRREKLVERFQRDWPGNAAATNVAGYVARGREWGLVEPKLVDARYLLTERGGRAVEDVGI